MVDVLVTGDRLAYPRVAPIVAAQESRDLGRHQHTVAGHVRVARRARARRVRQVPCSCPGMRVMPSSSFQLAPPSALR
jgi:hypothetical protein